MAKRCPYKMAALRLAMVSLHDQRWVLQQLPESSRQRIQSELAMLARLKISNYAELLQEALDQPAPMSMAEIFAKSDCPELGPMAKDWFQKEFAL